MLAALFPSLRITGATHSPGAAKQAAAAALSYGSYGALVYMLAGQAICSALGAAEPPWLAAQREARWPFVVAFFVGSQLGGGLLATGAYEVRLNGALLHSKLASGTVPTVALLAARIAEAAALKPDAAVAAQLGLQL